MITDIKWPGGARAAVLLSVNLDGERALLGQHPHLASMDKTLSTSRYGMNRGVQSILEVLDDAAVPATWFVPGEVARTHGDLVQRVASAHEVALRGDDVAPIADLSAQQRRVQLRRAFQALLNLEITCRGFRLPAGEWPEGLAQDLLDTGLDWSSSFVGDDLPFELPAASGRSVLEVPWDYGCEDRQAFEWNFSPAIPAGHSRIASYDDVLENWMWEFDGALHEGSMFVLSLTPHVIATPGRIALLGELITHMRSGSDVWFATGSEIADFWRTSGQSRGVRHPAQVYLEESTWTSF